MALAKYKQKRKFDKTPEPKGGKPSGKDLIFVIQKHQASHLHYDFRLEMDGTLKSWAVPKGPSLNPDDKRLAMMVEDHPIDYAKFEGIIPEGNYGAGSVMIWDYGRVYAVDASGKFEGSKKENEKQLLTGLHKNHITFWLEGKKLRGEFALIKIKNQRDAKGNAWLLVKADDDFAEKRDVLKQDESAVSGRRMEEIAGQADRIWGSNKKAKVSSKKAAVAVKKN